MRMPVRTIHIVDTRHGGRALKILGLDVSAILPEHVDTIFSVVVMAVDFGTVIIVIASRLAYLCLSAAGSLSSTSSVLY